MKWPTPAILAVIVAIGFMWLKSHDARVRAEALGDARRDSIMVVLAIQDSVDAVADSIQLALSADASILRDSLEVHENRYIFMKKESRNLVDSLTLALLRGDTVTNVQIVTVIDTLIAEADACADALGGCKELNLLYVSQLNTCTSGLGLCREQRERFSQLYLEEQGNKPGLLSRYALPVAVITFALGIIIGH